MVAGEDEARGLAGGEGVEAEVGEQQQQGRGGGLAGLVDHGHVEEACGRGEGRWGQ